MSQSLLGWLLMVASLLCLAAAAWVAAWAKKQQQHRLVEQMMAFHLKNQDGPMAHLTDDDVDLPGHSDDQAALKRVFQRADWPLDMNKLKKWSLMALAVWVGTAVLAGPNWALAALFSGLALLWFVVVRRMNQVKRGMVQMLPTFLETMIRSANTGNSLATALVSATVNLAPSPLKQCMEQASSLAQAGMDVDRAMMHVSRIYDLDSLKLIGATLHMSTVYGGQVDQVLQRIVHFLRDQTEAQQELMALSSETRLSALVIGLLPALIGAVISLMNPAYMKVLWQDPGGQKMLTVALGMQMLGSVLLFRMTRMKGHG